MNWSFDNVRFFTQKISGSMKQIIAQLQPLSGGTVYQIFGYESDKTKISGFVVGDTDKNILLGLRKTGLSYSLLSPEGDLGDYFVNSISVDREKAVYQTMRPDLSCTSPVYTIELELFLDE